MAYNDPKEGSSTNAARDKGYWTALDGTLRRPDNSTVTTIRGPLVDNNGTLQAKPAGSN